MTNAAQASVPGHIIRDLQRLPVLLAEAGYAPVKVTADESFGNFAVTYAGPRGIIQIARDRGQFIVSGPSKTELEESGLWRTFVGARKLELPLKQWLGTANEA
jgi:hypothetical protein